MSEERECRRVQARFLALEEGELGAAEERGAREHLASCHECRAAWERWEAEGHRLRQAMQPVSPPRDVAGAAVVALRAGRRPRGSLAGRRRVLRWAAAAAAALAAGVGLWVYRSQRYEQVGHVAVSVGEPTAQQRGAREPSVVGGGAAIYNGAALATAAGEELEVKLTDGSRLVLGERTEAVLSGSGVHADCGHHLPHVCLLRGEVLCELESLRYFRAVGTPLGSAIVEGTTFRVRYEPGERAILRVLEGEVTFSCPHGEVRAWPGSVWLVDATVGVPRLVTGMEDGR